MQQFKPLSKFNVFVKLQVFNSLSSLRWNFSKVEHFRKETEKCPEMKNVDFELINFDQPAVSREDPGAADHSSVNQDLFLNRCCQTFFSLVPL